MIPLTEHRFVSRSFYNFDENLNQPRHRWYPFKEGFSNQLVREAISHVDKGKQLSILDPFAGSGTTALTAALSGHRAVGVEVNPFCGFAARVKSVDVQWRRPHFVRKVEELVEKVESSDQPSRLENFSSFSERSENEKWLFDLPVIRAATALIDSAREKNCSYSNAFVLAGIRAAMACCNAKKDGKCLRYFDNWDKQKFSEADFLRAFRRYSEMMLEDVEMTPIPKSGHSSTLVGDSRKVLETLPVRSFDLLVTSPPYLNSFDYSDVYRPELFLGGFVSDNTSLRRVRMKTLRSHVQVAWDGTIEIENPLILGLTQQLREVGNLWSKRLPEMVEAYFDDMSVILKRGFSLLKKGGQAWIVVSTSSYYGVHIPVDVLLAELGREAGFSLEGIYILRNLRGAGQQRKLGSTSKAPGLPLRESLIVLKK